MIVFVNRNADFRFDLDPDPYGYGIPGDIDYIDDIDSQSDGSLNLENSFDGSELSVFEINDSISKPVQSKVSSPTTDLPRKNPGN